MIIIIQNICSLVMKLNDEVLVHQLTPDNKIDSNIVLKCRGYLCFLCVSYVLFMCFFCSLYGLLCAITLLFVIIYLYHIISLIVCALYEHFSRSE